MRENNNAGEEGPSVLTTIVLLSLKCGRPLAGLIQRGIELGTWNDPRVEWSGWIHVCRMNSPSSRRSLNEPPPVD